MAASPLGLGPPGVMSPGGSGGDFASLVRQLMAADDRTRKGAEAIYDRMIRTNAVVVAASLLEEIRACPEVDVRQMSAVLIRGVLVQGASPAWPVMTAEQHASVRHKLLASLGLEPIAAVKRHIVHAIALVAQASAFAGTPSSFVLPAVWPELLTGCNAALVSPSSDQRFVGLRLVQTLLDYLGSHLAEPWAAALRPTLIENMKHSEALVAAQAARTAAALIRRVGASLSDADSSAAGRRELDAGDAGLFTDALPPGMQSPGSHSAAASAASSPGAAAAAAASPTKAASTASQAMVAALQSDVLPVLLETVTRTFTVAEDDTRHCVQDLISVVHSKPTFVRPVLASVVRLMLAVVGAERFEESTRTNALELVVALCEFGGGMVRKSPALLDEILAAVIGILASVADDPRWPDRDSDPYTYSFERDERDVPLLHFAGEALDRLASALGGKQVVPRVTALVTPWLRDVDWRRRRAAVLAMALISDGCKAHLVSSIDTLARFVAAGLEDPHPRVKFSTIRALAQFAEDFSDVPKGRKTFQATTHTWILPSIMRLCVADGTPATERVRTMAAHFFVRFFYREACKRGFLAPLEPLMRAMFALCESSRLETRVEALTALASLASVLEGDFAPYYGVFMPIVRRALGESIAAGPAGVALRNRALECTGVLCGIVDAAVCSDDARAIMEVLRPSLDPETLSAEPHDSYRFVAMTCAHVANALKEHFAPYLPVVLPALIRVASIEIEPQILELSPDETDDFKDEARGAMALSDDVGFDGGATSRMSETLVELPGVGIRKIVVDGVALQNKATAATVLFHFAQSVGAPLLPYVDTLAAALLSCVMQQSSEITRTMGVCTLPHVLRVSSFDTVDASHGTRLLADFMDKLITAMRSERSDTVMCTITEAMTEMIRFAAQSGGRVSMAPPVVLSTLGSLRNLIDDCLGRWEETTIAYQDDEDYDERKAEMLIEALETEREILSNLMDCLGQMIRAGGAAILPAVNSSVLPSISPLLEVRDQPMLRNLAMCLYDDLFEHTGPAAIGYLPTVAPHMFEGMHSPDPELRQSSCFGAGLILERMGASIASFAAGLVQGLLDAIAAPDKDRPEMAGATDNAVAALLKAVIAINGPLAGSLPADKAAEALRAILAALPLQADTIEARHVHSWFLDRVVACDPAIVGSDGSLASAALQLVAQIAVAHAQSIEDDPDDALLSPEDVARIPAVGSAVGARFPAAAADAARRLTPAQLQALRDVGIVGGSPRSPAS